MTAELYHTEPIELGTLKLHLKAPYHDREDDGDGLYRLDDPEHRQTRHLYRREHVDAAQRYRPKEHVVRLVLGRHEDD